jgi:hypothetical protein
MQGRRTDVEPHLQQPGDYGKWEGLWFCRPPWKHAGGCLGNGTSHHKVTEHEDGTITASPSILITIPGLSTGPATWHGFLEKGVWREC